MKMILTSFLKSGLYIGQKFSVARWQPKGFDYPVLDFLAAFDKYDKPLHLRNFNPPLEGYAKAWWEAVTITRWEATQNWLSSLSPISMDIILCCWCPYSAATQAQIRQHSSFACHTGLIGKLIQQYRPGIGVEMDEDRRAMLVKSWRPEKVYMFDQ